MHTLEEIRAEYARLDKLCGVDTAGIDLAFSSRMTRRYGSFRYPLKPGGPPPRITIADFLREEEEDFWDTVRHEYAHAAVWLLHPGERHGHDAAWKSICQKIGCRPKSRAERSGHQAEALEARARYTVLCLGCGQETHYLRAGKVVQLFHRGRGDAVRCARCGGHDLRLFYR